MNSPKWVVKEVQPKEDYTLFLTFADGTKKVYNARPLLEKAIYSQLKNLSFFPHFTGSYHGKEPLWTTICPPA